MNQEVHANEVFSIQCSDTKCITHYLFVYEFGLKSKFFKKTKKHRWNNCSVIYIVFQGNTQIGAAKHLDTPHYQLSVAEIIKIVKLNSNKLKCNLKIIGSEGYVNDEFMYIQSMNVTVEKIPIQKAIIGLTKLKEPKNKYYNTMDIKDGRQREYVDLGYCSNRNCSRRSGCDLGLVIPRRHKFTTEKESVDLFMTTKDLLEMMTSSNVMKEYHINPNRLKQFAKSIHERNVVESIRLHKTYVTTSEEVICTDHIDNKNSKENKIVMWWSVLVHERDIVKRVGMVCYWRLSIDVYIKERYKHENYLLFAQKQINNIDKERHYFGNININNQDRKSVV